LGDDLLESDLVESKLLGRLQSTVNKLVDFEDTRAATYLLRVNFQQLVRAVHFMRTTPLDQWQAQAVKFDVMVRKAMESILGFPMSDPGLSHTAPWRSWTLQSCRASWHEAQKIAQEWVPPSGLSGQYLPQKEALLHLMKYAPLLVDSADTREAQRLTPCSATSSLRLHHSCDGKDTLLRPRNFQIAVAYHLGVHVLEK